METEAGTETLVLPPDNHFEKMLSYFAEGAGRGRFHEVEQEECLMQADLLQQARDLA